MKKRSIIGLSSIIVGASIAHAQDVPKVITQAAKPTKSADEIAKELANPNTPLASLNFKNQFRVFDGSLPGAEDETGYTLLFQPVFPFPVDDQGSVVFFRPAIPLIGSQPVFDGSGFDSKSGVGDIVFDLAYGRTHENGFLWAFGMVSSVPTASSNELGLGRLTVGPEFFVGKLSEKYVVGLFPSHQWDVAGWTDKSVNLTTIQPIATWLPGGGWNVGSAGIMTYDWDSEQWTVPLQIQAGKTVMLNNKPWKIGVEVNYYVDKPASFGPEWMIGLNITPVVENVFAKWLK